MLNQRVWLHSVGNVSRLGVFLRTVSHRGMLVHRLCQQKARTEGRERIYLASAPLPWNQTWDGREWRERASAPAALLTPCQPGTALLLSLCCLSISVFSSLPRSLPSTSCALFILSLTSFAVPLSLIRAHLFWQEQWFLFFNLTSARMGQILWWSRLYLAVNVKRWGKTEQGDIRKRGTLSLPGWFQCGSKMSMHVLVYM